MLGRWERQRQRESAALLSSRSMREIMQMVSGLSMLAATVQAANGASLLVVRTRCQDVLLPDLHTCVCM